MSQQRQRDLTFGLDEASAAQRPVTDASLAELLGALVNGWCLGAVVPMALTCVERNPLANAGQFDGDLMRGLMEVPGPFWGRHPRLYDRYREALRRSAALRRRMSVEERMKFWSPLELAGDQQSASLNAEQGTTPSPPRDG
ncbi:MAG TPA: contact-dependent growth inhibition system immunity protein [Gemmatimonadaceae bacterium]|jgi:hypothetical protein